MIIQANLHHSKAATDLLVRDVLKMRPQVVVFAQEPWVSGAEGIPVGIPKDTGSYHYQEGYRATIFSKECSPLLCPKYTGRDFVTCQVTLGNQKELYLVSVYADINVSHLPPELDRLLEERGDN